MKANYFVNRRRELVRQRKLGKLIIPLIMVLLIGVGVVEATETSAGWVYPASPIWAPNAYEMSSDLFYCCDGWPWQQRYIRPEAWMMRWSQDRLDWIRNNGQNISIVFHVFRPATNCVAQFDYAGGVETNFEEWDWESKWAGCLGEIPIPDVHNEVRITDRNPWAMQANWDWYYAHAYFEDYYREMYGTNGPAAEFTYDCYYGNAKGYMSKYGVSTGDAYWW